MQPVMQLVQPEPIHPKPVAPALGKVQWVEGSIHVGVRPARTVSKDDRGYPVGVGVDPGEVVGTGADTDEDGVGQL